MNELLSAAILGLVQGLTEFLPVSSSGHLILTSAIMGLDDAAIKSFEVFIQLGSIFAVVVLYRRRFLDLLTGILPGRASEESGAGKAAGFKGWRGIGLLFITCLPAGLLGLFAYGTIKEYLFTPLTVALALAVGAVLMLLIERYKKNPSVIGLEQITPKMALCIGLAQCCSLWPGFSRSASTIMGGMIMGADRKTAAEYSFIAAVPIMFAAVGYDLYKSMGSLGAEHLPFFAVGFVAAFFSALLAIKTFIALLGRVGFAPFAVYRLLLAPLVYWFFVG